MRQRNWRGRDARLLMHQTGMPDPLRAVARVAQDLLDEAGFAEPPFRPEVLASLADIAEVRRRHMEHSARLVPEGGRLVIEVNAEHSRGRQNFSIDHEILHTLMPTYSGNEVEDHATGEFLDTSEEELLCDHGASVLLLDPRRLEPTARELDQSLDTLFSCADIFEASLEATARALASLDLWPCAFVFWEQGFRKAERVPAGQTRLGEDFSLPEPLYRVQRAYVAPSFGWFIPHNKSVPAASAIGNCGPANPRTSGMDLLELKGKLVSVQSQNRYASYNDGSTRADRVISLLMREDAASGQTAIRPPRQLFGFE